MTADVEGIIDSATWNAPRDWDEFFAVINAEPEAAIEPSSATCPRCDGEVALSEWVCPLCGGAGHVNAIERKGWDD